VNLRAHVEHAGGRRGSIGSGTRGFSLCRGVGRSWRRRARRIPNFTAPSLPRDSGAKPYSASFRRIASRRRRRSRTCRRRRPIPTAGPRLPPAPIPVACAAALRCWLGALRPRPMPDNHSKISVTDKVNYTTTGGMEITGNHVLVVDAL
jgi:hypothetical protein